MSFIAGSCIEIPTRLSPSLFSWILLLPIRHDNDRWVKPAGKYPKTTRKKQTGRAVSASGAALGNLKPWPKPAFRSIPLGQRLGPFADPLYAYIDGSQALRTAHAGVISIFLDRRDGPANFLRFAKLSPHQPRMRAYAWPRRLADYCFVIAFMPSLMRAGVLQPDTIKTWDTYIQKADARMLSCMKGGQPFLWVDESAQRRRDVQRGEVVIAPVLNPGGIVEVPNGLIHDWIGAEFIPDSTIEKLLVVLGNYSRYKDIYKPVVAGSQLLACNGENVEFSMIWRRHVLFVNPVIEGHCQTRNWRLDAHRGCSVGEVTRIREIEEYGQPGEHFLPSDTGSGFLWRIHSITRYQERDGGVYLEVEGIALSRDIPSSFRWLVSPIVKRLSASSLEVMLRRTRDAAMSPPHSSEAAQLCPR